MPRRKITREERDRAIQEADSILRLGKKWQRNTPNERRPNFEAAAATILRRTIGSKVVSGSLQHQHNEREARLLERTLKIGTLPPEVLHSFQTGRARKAAEPLRIDRGPDPDHLPDFELYMQDHVHNLGRPGHYDIRRQQFQGHMHAPHSTRQQRIVPSVMPQVQVPGGDDPLAELELAVLGSTVEEEEEEDRPWEFSRCRRGQSKPDLNINIAAMAAAPPRLPASPRPLHPPHPPGTFRNLSRTHPTLSRRRYPSRHPSWHTTREPPQRPPVQTLTD